MINVSAAQTVNKQAAVKGKRFTRDKFFYYRYWRIVTEGQQKKFWVYAAAETEPITAHSCSTMHDPEAGAIQEIQGRQDIYGFSNDKFLSVKSANGEGLM